MLTFWSFGPELSASLAGLGSDLTGYFICRVVVSVVLQASFVFCIAFAVHREAMSNPLDQDSLALPSVSGEQGRKGKGVGNGSRDGTETTGLASELQLRAAMADDRKKTKQLYEALDQLFVAKAGSSVLLAQLEKAELSAAMAIGACRRSFNKPQQ